MKGINKLQLMTMALMGGMVFDDSGPVRVDTKPTTGPEYNSKLRAFTDEEKAHLATLFGKAKRKYVRELKQKVFDEFLNKQKNI